MLVGYRETKVRESALQPGIEYSTELTVPHPRQTTIMCQDENRSGGVVLIGTAMGSYLVAALVGAIFPWIILRKTLVEAFRENTITGVGTGIGMSLMTVPIALFILWIAQLVSDI